MGNVSGGEGRGGKRVERSSEVGGRQGDRVWRVSGEKEGRRDRERGYGECEREGNR